MAFDLTDYYSLTKFILVLSVGFEFIGMLSRQINCRAILNFEENNRVTRVIPTPCLQNKFYPPITTAVHIAILILMERAHRIFPNTLRIHRQTFGYTQRQVAALLGLHDTVPISLWEKGVKLPNTINLIKLSLLYRTFPNELYSDVFLSLREELKIKEVEQFNRI